MKFTCLQENLAKGLNIVSKAIPIKTSLPIATNVLIETDNGRLKLSATNLETAISTYVGASVEQDGSITIPAKLLKEFVSNLSPSTLTAHLDDTVLHISSEKTKSKFNGTSSADFPPLPVLDKKAEHIELDPKVFSAAVNVVAFAAAADETRPIFTGIYLNFADKTLTIAACDGFRLSEKKVNFENEIKEFSIIIPAKTLIEVARIFANSNEPIKLVLNETENLALFESEDTLVASRILDGEYPDYKRIIPSSTSVSAEFLANELLEAVKLTNVFAKEANGPIKMKLDPKGTISLATTAQEIGEHESQIAAEIKGDPFEIAFNSKYLLDFLNNVKSEKIILEANGNVSPCLIKPSDHENFLHIIMPMQIQ